MTYEKKLSVWTDSRVRAALAVIEQRHANASLRLGDVADEVGLSPCYLSHVIKIATGLGFRDHLRRIRIAASLPLLSARRLSVKEAAASVGFNSTSAFDREFKRLNGVTPSMWRSQDD
jgi:two-component system, response regulator YesN